MVDLLDDDENWIDSELKIKEPKHKEVYPPVGTPDTALVLSLDGDYCYTIFK